MSVKKKTVAKRGSIRGATVAKTVSKGVLAKAATKSQTVKMTVPKIGIAKTGTAVSGGNTVINGGSVKEASNNFVEQKPVFKKPEIFKTGDKVVYPAHGVGAIDSIQSRIIGGSDTQFYMITILETGMKVMVPVSQAGTVGLRKIVDAKTVEKVYDILRDRDVIVLQQTWNRRHREYTQKLKTGSVFEIASVIRDLSVLKGDKELSFGERKMLDLAQGLLVKELSIAKAKTEELIKTELQSICDAV